VSTSTAERTSRSRGGAAAPRHSCAVDSPSLFDGAGGGQTLDEVLSGAWEELAAQTATRCPMCPGDMEPEYGAHSRPVGGRCRSCGTALT
jgi:hypothetical protein